MKLLNIPCELVEEILRRLPMESIKRFQCVSKSWCLLINNEFFIKSQLQWSLAKNSRRHLIMSLSGEKIFSIDLDGPGKIQVVDIPSCLRSIGKVSNSCNGLVLVESEPPVLWNPFTRDYKILSGYDPNIQVFYGFAYDSMNEDYKVVRVLEQYQNMPAETLSRTEIYSLKSDSWKIIKNFAYRVPFSRGNWSFHIRGALHAIVRFASGDTKVMAFSVETERHNELELPSCTVAELNLCTLGGCLSITSKTEHQISIWVMKDYGETKSWTKMLSLRYLHQIDCFDRVKPLAYSKDGHKVMLIYNDEDYWLYGKDTKLVWFDLRNNTMENINVAGLPDKFRAEACVNSLVPLHQVKKHL